MKLGDFEDQLTSTVERVSEGVVRITSAKLARNRVAIGAGTGVVVSDGYIVTNNHVIEGAEEVVIETKGGRTLDGHLVGTDELTDIALIEVDGKLPIISLGDSGKLKAGQIAIAIGNSLGMPGDFTVSMGVVSALGRPLPGSDFIFEGMIQTDASINPGNSGGPLSDINGNIIGINTAIIPYAQGVGFAIPINAVKRIVEQISKNGRVIRPWMGVSCVSLNKAIASRFGLETEEGILIKGVQRGGSAHEAGIAPGDIIIEMENKKIKRLSDLLEEIGKKDIGDEAKISVLRDRIKYSGAIPLREMPASVKR